MDRLVRKLIPSAAKLSYNSLFKALGLPFDFVANLIFPALRELPPNHLRVRVGVGNRVFFNQFYHIEAGYYMWLTWFPDNLFTTGGSILEIGCGCGRMARPLKTCGFSGAYTGIDIDEEMLKYCKDTFPQRQFQFHRSSHQSKTYSKIWTVGLPSSSYYRVPLQDDSQDFVFSTSLFTNILEDNLLNYLKEAYRVLKSGGTMIMSFNCLNAMKEMGSLGGRWTFAHRIGNAFVESLRYPEACVAYEKDFISRACEETGFSPLDIEFELGSTQSRVKCKK